LHPECEAFLASLAIPMAGAHVLEVGAYTINGRARDHLPGGWATWTGIDRQAGPDVDLVGDAATVLAGLAEGSVDVAVTTETLEHTADWPAVVAGMLRVLRPGGWLIVTCASPTRYPHSALDGLAPRAGEHYAGVSVAELAALIAPNALLVRCESDPRAGDTRLVARVRPR
jgi:hypothetical protein